MNQLFQFETSFDSEDPLERLKAHQPSPTAPSFSQAELDAAHQQGFAEGQAAGQQAALNGLEAQIASQINLLAQHVSAFMTAMRAEEEARAEAALQTGLMIARKMLPAFIEREGEREIAGLIAQVVADLRQQPRLVLRLPEALFEPLKARLSQLTEEAGFSGKVILLADETLQPGDAKLEWADGGAQRDVQALWQQIDAALIRLAGSAELGQQSAASGPPASLQKLAASQDQPEGKPESQPESQPQGQPIGEVETNQEQEHVE